MQVKHVQETWPLVFIFILAFMVDAECVPRGLGEELLSAHSHGFLLN